MTERDSRLDDYSQFWSRVLTGVNYSTTQHIKRGNSSTNIAQQQKEPIVQSVQNNFTTSHVGRQGLMDQAADG